MHCSISGKELPEGSAFCQNCTTPVSPPAAAGRRPHTAFALSFVGGILILLNGATLGFLLSFISMLTPELHQHYLGTLEEAISLTAVSAVLQILSFTGLAFGVTVVLGAIMLYSYPQQRTVWGVIVLTFSVMSIIMGGGFLVGVFLSIIGAALGISWQP